MGTVEIQVMLMSFIWVVGLTRVLESFGALWVARKRVRFAASQLLWMAAILVDIMGNWLAAANVPRDAPGWLFACNLLYSLGLFFAATVVSPKIPNEGVLDLAVYETEEGAAYKVTFIVLMLLAYPIGYGINAPVFGPPTLGIFLMVTWSVTATLVAFAVGLTRRKRLRTAAALAALLLAIYGFAANVIFTAIAAGR